MTEIVEGGSIRLSTVYAIDGVPTDTNQLGLVVATPSGVEQVETGTIVHDGIGEYHAVVVGTEPGLWRYRWTVGTDVADEGTFEVSSIYEGGVTDIRDLRVLIPACRRAIDGPQATAPDSPATSLDDGEVLGLLADATADLILNTASRDGSDMNAFGNQLIVVERDPFYMAPISWATDQPRSTAQDAAILSQAALDHYFWMLKGMKTSETMKNEAVEWTYTILSPAVLLAWIQYLIGNRDKAIAALQSINVVMDVYISLVAERDRLSATWLEPWVTEIGAPVPYVGGGGQGPLEYDYRFNTWG